MELSDKQIEALKKLRAPFTETDISKLPKPTKKQIEEVRSDYKAGIRCDICGGWHHPQVIHLDYVGHAALTNRLLDVDICWDWEPVAVDEVGNPVYDKYGGLWIKLTVSGMTRRGYGHAADKTGGDAIKEIIGDALRNAGMRFGMALDLWHKGYLSSEEPEQPKSFDGLPESVKELCKQAGMGPENEAFMGFCRSSNWDITIITAALTKKLQEMAK